MRFRPSLFACGLLLFVATSARAADEKLEAQEEQAFKQAAALVDPSIVQIQTTGGKDIVGRILTGTGPTTGVVVSKDGYIISSAFNFISKPSTILVNLADGRKNQLAKVIATDRSKMLTLIKIKADNLVPAPAAKKSDIQVGQWSIAMGRTFSLDVPSVSVGIISAKDRIFGRALQTDAKISPVNYGGPLVGIDGKVQGLLVPLSTRGKGETAGAEWYDSGIGFAIPMEDVYTAVERLKKGNDLEAGLLGITMKEVGILGGEPVVDRVRANSPSEKAGLKPGDRILEVDGKKIIRSTGIRHAIGAKYAGDTVAMKIKRGGKTLDKKVTLAGKLEPFEPAYLGILPQRRYDGEKPRPGVGVRFVFKDSPAGKAELKALDRIVKVNGKEVADAESLADTISRLKPKSQVKLEYLRGKDRKTATVTLTTVPTEVVAELNDPLSLPGKDVKVKTGRFTKKMPKHEREYWAYVPKTYNPKRMYGLMVWLHPTNDTMEAAIFKKWQRICDERGILIIGPKAGKLEGWTPNETEFVKAAVDEFAETYSVDPARIFAHTFSNGATFAFQTAFKHNDTFRGVAVAGGAMRTRPGGNSPVNRMQFHFIVGDKDPVLRFTKIAVRLLQTAKYPTGLTTVKDLGEEYPAAKYVKEFARWADCLDRI